MARNELAVPAVSSSSKSDKQNRGELDCLRIETAENGFSCETRFEPKKQPNDRNNLPYPSSELTVYTDLKSLLAYVSKTLTAQAAYEKGEE